MPLMLVAGMTLFAALRCAALRCWRERWRPRGLVLARTVAALIIATGAAPRIAHAADGVIEINQAAVTSFPYVISQPGSYMLTSDLSVANLGTPAIRIDVHDVTLDLNGFSIQDVFSGGPAAAAIDATGRARISIRDGRVKDFVGDCVVAGYLAVISDVVVTGCGENGLELGSSATVRHVGAHSNGNHGIETLGRSRISDSLTSYNISDGVHGAGKFVLRSNRMERETSRAFRTANTSDSVR